jgi:hypothetical protein
MLSGSTPAAPDAIFFLLDVDNTLLDNDRFAVELGPRIWSNRST